MAEGIERIKTLSLKEKKSCNKKSSRIFSYKR